MKNLTPIILTLYITFFLIIFSVQLKAQTPANSFKILTNNILSQEDFYIQSISSAYLENYRLRNERVKLEFKEGF